MACSCVIIPDAGVENWDHNNHLGEKGKPLGGICDMTGHCDPNPNSIHFFRTRPQVSGKKCAKPQSFRFSQAQLGFLGERKTWHTTEAMKNGWLHQPWASDSSASALSAISSSRSSCSPLSSRAELHCEAATRDPAPSTLTATMQSFYS